MNYVARLLLGPWCVAVLAAGVIVPIGAVVAYGELAARLRKRRDGREWAAGVAAQVRTALDFEEWEREIYGRETTP